MFRVCRLGIDTLSEHVVFLHEAAVREGALGVHPLDRVRVVGLGGDGTAEVTAVLNFCRADLIAKDEVGLSEAAFADLGLPEGAGVEVTLARSPESVELVRRKLRGARLSRADFDEVLRDVCARRYSKPELAMFVLACALRRLDDEELIALTEAMIDSGSRLRFDAPVVADKHSIGGIPGNRTTLVVVPIVASLGVTVPKTSSRAITSPAGTADTMAVFAEVALSPARIYEVVAAARGCIAWGGALQLAPADDVLITVERPMGIDTEAQMIASILSKKRTAGATHALIDVPLGPTAKVRSRAHADQLAALFTRVGAAIGLDVDVAVTAAHGPIGRGIGPRLEALDVLDVLRREPDAPADLREKSLYLAGRLLERVGAVPDAGGYRAAQEALDSGRALATFERIVDAQGRRALPEPAPFKTLVRSHEDGRVREIDCFEIGRIGKLAGAPANSAAGVRLLRGVGAVVQRGEPLFEIHAQSSAQLAFAEEHAAAHPETYDFGF